MFLGDKGSVYKVNGSLSNSSSKCFKVATSSHNNSVLLSINEAAVYQFILPNATTPSNSWSLPNKMVLHTPAIWLGDADNPAIMDGDEEDIVIPRIKGSMYAVLHASSDMKKNESAKVVACWTHESESSMPCFTKMFNNPISAIETLSNNRLILLHSNGNLTVTSADLSKDECSFAWAALECNLLYSKFIREDAHTMRIFLCLESSSGNSVVAVKTLLVCIDANDHTEISETKSCDMNIQVDSLSHICVDDQFKTLIIAASHQMDIYHANGGSFIKTRTIPLKFDIGQASLHPVSASHFAVLTALKKDSGKSQDVLMIYDTVYGTLQVDLTVSSGVATDTHHLGSIKCNDESFFLCCNTNVTAHTFATFFSMIPYQTSEISLLDALGRGQQDNLVVLDPRVIELCDKKKTASINEFEKKFSSLITSKKNLKISQCPVIALSQEATFALTSRMLNDSSCYSKVCMEYLIKTGCMSAQLGNDGSLVKLLLSKPDSLSTVKLALMNCPDALESDIVETMRAVCGDQVKSLFVRGAMLEYLVSIPRNDVAMVQAMSLLNHDVVLNLIEWIESTLGMEPPALDQWIGKNQSSQEMAFELLTLIVDAHFSFIVLETALHARIIALRDSVASYSTFCTSFDKGLLGFLERAKIEQARLLAVEKVGLVAKVAHTEPKHQRRWQRMVGDVNDGVGAYAVEYFAF